MSIRVDPEFRSLIPALTAEEYRILEINLDSDGCRDALVTWNGLLLDGHNRKEICERLGIGYAVTEIGLPDRSAAMQWIINNQFGRRNLTPFQRAELALKLEPLIAAKAKGNQGKRTDISQNSVESLDTQKELAKLSGLSHDTIHKAKIIADRAPEQMKDRLRRGEATIHEVYKDVRKQEQKDLREQAYQSALAQAQTTTTDRCRLIHSDLLAADVAIDSLDWIITDPPYPREYLPLYSDLACFASRTLRPGGSLLCMIGHSYLPEVISALTAGLEYHWICAYLTPGGQSAQIWPRKVNQFWKPLLWFVKGEYVGDWVGDVCRSNTNDNDKRFHSWGQSESGMADIIERFTLPNDLICDPFLGGGTTGIVALRLNRRFIGIDNSEEAIRITSARLEEVLAAV